jgi:hypothetical protein
MPLPLYPRYPLDRRLGGNQSRSAWRGAEKNFPLPGKETGQSSPYSSLYRLSYPVSLCYIIQIVILKSSTFCDMTQYSPFKVNQHVSPKRRSTLNVLHDVMSQKTELFVTTALRTSDSYSNVRDQVSYPCKTTGEISADSSGSVIYR